MWITPQDVRFARISFHWQRPAFILTWRCPLCASSAEFAGWRVAVWPGLWSLVSEVCLRSAVRPAVGCLARGGDPAGASDDQRSALPPFPELSAPIAASFVAGRLQSFNNRDESWHRRRRVAAGTLGGSLPVTFCARGSAGDDRIVRHLIEMRTSAGGSCRRGWG